MNSKDPAGNPAFWLALLLWLVAVIGPIVTLAAFILMWTGAEEDDAALAIAGGVTFLAALLSSVGAVCGLAVMRARRPARKEPRPSRPIQHGFIGHATQG